MTPLASRNDASSNLYHSMSEDKLSLRMVAEGEKVPKEKNTESARKRRDSSVNNSPSEDRLGILGYVPSPRATVGAEDSLADTDCSYLNVSAKKRRLDSVLLNGVSQRCDVLHDHCVKKNPALRDFETEIVETKNLKLKLDPCGTQCLRKREERHERKGRRLHSSKKADNRLLEEKDNEMLQQIADQLTKENSKLTNRLVSMSEKCQEINKENNLLMDELEEFGPDAISDLRATNPTNSGSNSDGEKTQSSDDISSDQQRDDQ